MGGGAGRRYVSRGLRSAFVGGKRTAVMEIYILRHGDAEPRSAEVEEADRKLTSKGRRDVERVMRAAAAAQLRPDLALTPPYPRPLQPAHIALRHLDPKPHPPHPAALPPH